MTLQGTIHAIVLPLVCLAMDLQGSARAASPEVSELAAAFEKFRDGVAHVGQRDQTKEEIIIEKWLGSGFLVDDRCTFVTAKHIFRGADRERLILRFQRPQQRSKVNTLATRILYEDPQTDLAFLRIDYVNNQPCHSKSLQAFSLMSNLSGKQLGGETVVIIGHPVLAGGTQPDIPVVRSGIIASSELRWGSSEMLLLDLFGVPGFSGSPVILQRTGEVVGVIFGPGPTKRVFGFEWATPIKQTDYSRALEEARPSQTRINSSVP